MATKSAFLTVKHGAPQGFVLGLHFVWEHFWDDLNVNKAGFVGRDLRMKDSLQPEVLKIPFIIYLLLINMIPLPPSAQTNRKHNNRF